MRHRHFSLWKGALGISFRITFAQDMLMHLAEINVYSSTRAKRERERERERKGGGDMCVQARTLTELSEFDY